MGLGGRKGRLTIAVLLRTGQRMSAARIAGVVGAILLIGVVAVLVRVSVAPLLLPMTGWAEGKIAEATGGTGRVGAMGVQIGFGSVSFVATDVRVRQEHVSAALPRVTVTIGFSGRTVSVDGLRLTLDPKGSRDGPAGMPPPTVLLGNLDKGLSAAASGVRRAGFRTLTIKGGRVDLVTAGRPVSEARVFQHIDATLTQEGPRFVLSLNAVGAEGPITFDISREESAGGATIDIAAQGIAARDLLPIKPVQNGFALAPRMTATFSKDGALIAAEAELQIGKGTVVFGRDPPRTLDSATVSLSFEGESVRVLPSAFVAGGTRVTISGLIDPPERNLDEPWQFDLKADGARFHPPDIDGPPVSVDRLIAKGSMDWVNRLIHVEEFGAGMPTGRLDAVMTFDFSANGPTLAGAAQLGPSTIPTLLAAWPPVIAYDPRKALKETILGGTVRGGTIQMSLTPLELDGNPETSDMIEGGLSIDIAFVDATLVNKNLPFAITRADGILRLRDKQLVADIRGGTIRAGEHGDLAVDTGRLIIRELGANPSVANITAKVRGPLPAVVQLAETMKIEQVADLGVTPEDVTGNVEADLSLVTPMADEVDPSQLRWSIDARLLGAGSKVPIQGRKVENASVEILVNARRLAARGRATIDGLTVDINYSELFAGERSSAARFVLTDKDRRERGFDTGSMVRGPVVVTIEAGEDGTQAFTADLSEAAVSVPGFSKPSGRELLAEGIVRGDPAAMTIENVRLEGDGINVRGDVEIAGGALRRAELTNFALSRGDQAEVSVAPLRGGGYAITANAKSFDARKLLKGLTGDGGAASTGTITVEATGDKVRVRDDAYLTDLVLTATREGERLSRLALSGRFDGVNAGSFAARVSPNGSGIRSVQADITDLGRVLSAFNVYNRMRGGRATLEATLDTSGALEGRVLVTDFRLANEETLSGIIDQAAKERESEGRSDNPRPLAFQPTDVPQDDIVFERLMIDFIKVGDVITVREAILRGPVIGGTADGVIDLGENVVRLNGTFIPAFGVNNLFGRVPVFGEILGGGRKGGLIGVTFQLSGELTSPRLAVNPISAIAPGIFRRVFEFR